MPETTTPRTGSPGPTPGIPSPLGTPRAGAAIRAIARALPAFRGRNRVLLAIARLLNPRVARYAAFAISSEATVFLDLEDPNYWALYFIGQYEPEVESALRVSLRAGEMFVDCGANVGVYTCLAAGIVGPAGRVMSFEPLEELAQLVEASLRQSGFTHAEVVRAALGDHPGRATLHRGADDPRGHTSLMRDSVQAVSVATCDIVRLDDAVPRERWGRIALLKMDIEGAELPALRGAEQLLRTARPNLIVEINPETAERAGYRVTDVFGFLGGLGYRGHSSRAGEWIAIAAPSDELVGNILFIHPDRRATPAAAGQR